MQWFRYLDKREVLQQEYSKPPILPSPHFRWVVKGPYHQVTNWAEWAIIHVVTIVRHYRCIRLRVVVVVVVVEVVLVVKGPYHRVTNWAEWADPVVPTLPVIDQLNIKFITFCEHLLPPFDGSCKHGSVVEVYRHESTL